MKIVFFGTSDFALPSLEALIRGRHQISCVVTQPDRRRGRGLKVAPPPVKVLASKNGLPIQQPEDLKDVEVIKNLAVVDPHLSVVVAYGKILAPDILNIPEIFSICLHPSLLPKYRGPAPISWAIIRGEKETGVTVFKMDEHMDKGDILTQQKVRIEDEDTADTLADRLARVGADLLLGALDLIERGKATLTPQAETEATFAPLLKKEDGRIDWAKPSKEIHNFVRGMNPWPSAFTHIGGKVLKVWKTRVLPGKVEAVPGEVIEVGEEGITVATGDGRILILELQLEGKKRMSTIQFLLGHPVQAGERLTAHDLRA